MSQLQRPRIKLQLSSSATRDGADDTVFLGAERLYILCLKASTLCRKEKKKYFNDLFRKENLQIYSSKNCQLMRFWQDWWYGHIYCDCSLRKCKIINDFAEKSGRSCNETVKDSDLKHKQDLATAIPRLNNFTFTIGFSAVFKIILSWTSCRFNVTYVALKHLNCFAIMHQNLFLDHMIYLRWLRAQRSQWWL